MSTKITQATTRRSGNGIQIKVTKIIYHLLVAAVKAGAEGS